MDPQCLFCRIVKGEIPSAKVYEDDLCFAFADIAPKAPVHLLIVPREHFSSALEINRQREQLVGHLTYVAASLARERGIDQDGFRMVLNTNADAGQTVFHLHMHLLGGRQLGAMG